MGHTVGLRADGSVVAVGDNAYGQCDVEGWENVVAIAAGDWHTVGLCRDGTVVSTHPDPNKYPDMYLGACNVDEWKRKTLCRLQQGAVIHLDYVQMEECLRLVIMIAISEME